MIICEKYKIGSDRNNIVLLEKKEKKIKDKITDLESIEEVFTPIAWYPTIKLLLKNLPERVVRDNIEDIEALSNKIEKLREEILNLDFSELEKSLKDDLINNENEEEQEE